MKKLMEQSLGIRIVLYIIGLAFLATGSVCGVVSGLGVNATSSSGVVLSILTGLSLGTWTLITFCIFIALQLILTNKKNYVDILLQLPFSMIFATIMDFVMARLNVDASNVILKVLFMLIGIVLTAIGVILTVNVRLYPTAPDGVVQTIAGRFGWKFANTKNGFDLVILIFAIAIGLIFGGRLIGVGIGTVVSAILTGPAIGVLEKMMVRIGLL